MDTYAGELQTVLHDELTIHAECVKTAVDMHNALKEKNVERVQALTQRYDTAIEQIETLEERRLALCDGVTTSLNLKTRHVNFLYLIDAMPEASRPALLKLRTALKEKIEELVRVNTANRILLGESLAAIRNNFEIFSQIRNKFAGYRQSGAVEKNVVKKNIVNHIA